MSYTLPNKESADGEIRCPNRTGQMMAPNSRFWIYASLAALCVVVLTAFDFGSDFRLAPNGTTVLCDEADVGDTGEVDGTVYTKRTADQITTGNAATTCTSGITDMSGSWRTSPGENFFSDSDFNEDISTWDVSSVENMEGMFSSAASFNQDIGEWDVSSVENMFHMFRRATSFNQDIGSWDVSSVEDMTNMFVRAESFNQDISDWDVSSVINMSHMFNGASSFNPEYAPEGAPLP